MDEDGPYDRLDLGQIDDNPYTVLPARRDGVFGADTDEGHGHHDPPQIDDPTYANIQRKEDGDPPKTPQSDDDGPHDSLLGRTGDAIFIPMVNIESKKEEDPPQILQSAGDHLEPPQGPLVGDHLEPPQGPLVENHSGPPFIRRYQWVGVGVLCAVLALLSVAVPVYLYQTNLLERERLENRYNQSLDRIHNLTAQRNQSLDRIHNLTVERNQSLDRIHNLTAERNQSLDRIHNLTVERDCLKRRPCESDGFTLRDGLCYYISEEKRTWEESRQWCRDNHSDLMVVKSREKQDFVANFSMRVWLGLTDSEVEGSFQWVDGTPLTEPTFWYPGAPDAERHEPERGFYPNAEEDCVEYYDGSYLNSSAKGWNDLRCNDHPAYWICEKLLC